MSEGEGRDRWDARYASGERGSGRPSAWVLATAGRLPPDATLVDIAGGNGRQAIALARSGRRVIVVDFVERAVATARTAEPSLLGVVADAWRLPFAAGTLDAILVTNFLERALLPQLRDLLRPGGFLLYETYTKDHEALVAAGIARVPRSERYLLAAGELPRLVQPLQVLEHREGRVDDAAGSRCCASVLAQKPVARA